MELVLPVAVFCAYVFVLLLVPMIGLTLNLPVWYFAFVLDTGYEILAKALRHSKKPEAAREAADKITASSDRAERLRIVSLLEQGQRDTALGIAQIANAFE